MCQHTNGTSSPGRRQGFRFSVGGVRIRNIETVNSLVHISLIKMKKKKMKNVRTHRPADIIKPDSSCPSNPATRPFVVVLSLITVRETTVHMYTYISMYFAL